VILIIDTPTEVSVEIARGKLGDYVRAAQIGGKTTTLTYRGEPAALIVPIPSDGEQAHV
jgi:prevent-host-death family protein